MYTHAHTSICTYIYTNTHIPTHIQAPLYFSVMTKTKTADEWMEGEATVLVNLYVYLYIHRYIHKYNQSYKHTYTYIHA